MNHSRCLLPLLALWVLPQWINKNLTAEPGQNVTLPCRGPNNKTCVVEWIRTDLGKEYVFFYRERRIVTDRQHPSFVNRVDLQDRRLKDGEVSVVLQNVTINDTGRYECRVTSPGWEHVLDAGFELNITKGNIKFQSVTTEQFPMKEY
uniref:Ig-like domain-containing protein n=1 Tax=Amphilophus citrinellus TaxID=61819 RepID=A0A3Q0RBP4_AMPCI